jgi:plasmid stabilization system protein ParE
MTRTPRRHVQAEALPRREELEALARHYHHLQNEHKRKRPEGAVRRQIENRLVQTRERFDRLLEEWVPDRELREAWRQYLHNRAPQPDGPPAVQPLVFQGVSDAGSLVEIRGKGDELEVKVDGTPVERVVAEKDFAVDRPVVRFRLNHSEAEETFSASLDALRALADFLDDGGTPPWQHASELLADGLIDVHFDLTTRGRRALAWAEAGAG